MKWFDKLVGINCRTCGTGKNWWLGFFPIYKCPTCGANPLIGNGRSDWEDYSRAQMVKMFGPRKEGDAELLACYDKELRGRDSYGYNRNLY